MHFRTMISQAIVASMAVTAFGFMTPALAKVDGAAAKALASQKACLACHAVDKKVVGPSYKEVAAKHKGEAGAVEKVAARIKAGGSGTYGAASMPPQPSLSDKELKLLAEWVLAGAPDK